MLTARACLHGQCLESSKTSPAAVLCANCIRHAFILRPQMSLPAGTVPTVRGVFSYGISLRSYLCPYRKGQTKSFGPKIIQCHSPLPQARCGTTCQRQRGTATQSTRLGCQIQGGSRLLMILKRPLFRKNWTQSELNCVWKRPANFFLRGLYSLLLY